MVSRNKSEKELREVIVVSLIVPFVFSAWLWQAVNKIIRNDSGYAAFMEKV
jgi:hypothetical protein